MHTTPVAPTIDTSRPSDSRRDDSTRFAHDEPFDSVLERHSAPTQPSIRDRGDTTPRSDRVIEHRRTGRDGSPAAMEPRRPDPVAERTDTEHADDVDAADDTDRHRDKDADADIESSTHAAEAGVCTPTARLAIAADGTSQADVAQPVGEATQAVSPASTAPAGPAIALESRRTEIRAALPTDRSASVDPHTSAIGSEDVAPSTPNQQASVAASTVDEIPTVPAQSADPVDTPGTSPDALVDAPADLAIATTATDAGAAPPEMPSAVEPAHDPSLPTLPDPGTPAEVASTGEIRSTDVRTTEMHSVEARSGEDPSPELPTQAVAPEAQAAEITGAEMPTRDVTTRVAAVATATPSPESGSATPATAEIPSDSEITIEGGTDTARPSRVESSSRTDHAAADDASVPLHSTTPSTRTVRPVQPGRADHGTDTVRQHAEVPERSLLAQAELRRATGNGRRLDMGITTSDLGRVRVTAVEGAEGLQLQLSSDQTGGRAHLSQHLHELRTDLANRGLDIGALDVSAGDTGGHRDTSEPPVTPRITTAVAADQAVDPVRAVSNHGSARIPRHLDGLDLRL